MTLRRENRGALDPATGKRAAGTTDTESVLVSLRRVRSDRVDGVTVVATDLEGVLVATLLTIVPRPGDRLEDSGGAVHEVRTVAPLRARGQTLAYDVIVGNAPRG
jgi:hypothetical protein